MQRGIVIDIQAHHWVVMTADGSFIKVPKKNVSAELGEEVTFSNSAMPTATRLNWKAYVSAAAAAILALFFLFPSFLDNNEALAHSYVYVEVDPGVQVGLNDKLEVVLVQPINEEATDILEEIHWKEKPVKKVVLDYLKQAKGKGYLQKDKKIVLSSINEQDSNSSTLQTIRTEISQDPVVGERSLSLDVYTLSMPAVVKEKAEQSGLTPGKYAVWMLSKNSGKEIPIDQVAKMPISDLTSDVSVSTLLDHPPTEQEWNQIVKEDQDEAPKDIKNEKESKSDEQIDKQKDDKSAPSEDQSKENEEKNDQKSEQEKQQDSSTKDEKDQSEPTDSSDSKDDKEDDSDNQDEDNEDEEKEQPTSGKKGNTHLPTDHATP